MKEEFNSDLEFLTDCYQELKSNYNLLYKDYKVLQEIYKNVLEQNSRLNKQLTEKTNKVHSLQQYIDCIQYNDRLCKILKENNIARRIQRIYDN